MLGNKLFSVGLWDRGSAVVNITVVRPLKGNHPVWTHMLDTVDDLPCADLQNIHTRSTRAKDVLLIFADLKHAHKKRG